MTADPTLDLLRRLDPLAADADALDPAGPTAERVRTSALRAASPPAPARRRASRPAVRLAAAATAAVVVAGGAIAVGLPGGDGGHPTDARAALLTAAQRTAAFTSGHIVWRNAADGPDGRFHLETTNDVRFEGSSVAVDYVSHTQGDGAGGGPVDGAWQGGFRAVDGKVYARTSADGEWRRAAGPQDGADARQEVRVRIEAADALAAATRSAADVQEAAVDGGTRFTATLTSGEVPFQLRSPWSPEASPVTLVATVDEDGVVRSISVRGVGQEADVTFDGLGLPQQITAP